MSVPPAFDSFVELGKRVSPTCLISFERNRYSVPASFANRLVRLRVYPDRLVVAAEGHSLCDPVRIVRRSRQLPARAVCNWRHYNCVLSRKPGAFRNGAPFFGIPTGLQATARLHVAPNEAATGIWSIPSRWFCITMNKPCWSPREWLGLKVSPPRPMCRTCCIDWSTGRQQPGRTLTPLRHWLCTARQRRMSNAMMARVP